MSSSNRITLLASLLGATALSLAAPGAYAATCDLTGGIGSGGISDPNCALGSAIYENPDNTENVGSGLINPFLTVQQNGTESGFSTDAASNNLPLDVKRAEGNGQFTRTFTLGDLGFANSSGGIWQVGDGTKYYQFFLDINEPAAISQSGLSLDFLQIYNANDFSTDLGDGTTFADLTTLFGSALYVLGDDNVLLNFNVFGKGSGQGIDMDVLIDVSVFSSVDATDSLVFATAFGSTDPSQDGFEEWWYRTAGTTEVCPPPLIGTPPFCVLPPVVIPEPGGLALIGLGLAGLAAIRRRRLPV